MAEVSVIIPTYNYERFIVEAIRSVLSQTFSDFELFVVDDGSTDGTKDIVSTFKDPRITYIYQNNRGLSSARNIGLESSSGEYIGFLDADDLWMPEKLDQQLSLFQTKPSVGLIYTGYTVIDEAGICIATRTAQPIDGDLVSQLILGNIVSGSITTSLIRRKCFDKVGLFDETLTSCEDWDMWLRIARISDFACLKHPLAKIRLHSNNLTYDPKRMEDGLFYVVEKFYSDESLSNELKLLKQKAMAGAHRDSANFYFRRGLFRDGYGHLFNAVRLKPTWWEMYAFMGYMAYRICFPNNPTKRSVNHKKFI